MAVVSSAAEPYWVLRTGFASVCGQFCLEAKCGCHLEVVIDHDCIDLFKVGFYQAYSSKVILLCWALVAF